MSSIGGMVIYELELRIRPITQWCPDCRQFMELEQQLTFQGNYMVGDYTICTCGRELWRWTRQEGLAPIVYSSPPKPRPKKQLTLF